MYTVLFEKIAKRAAVIRNEGDFTDDETGLLRCGKCSEPKQQVVDVYFAHKKIVAFRACRCEREADAREKTALAEHDRRQRQKQLDMGIKSEAFKGYTFDSDDKRNIETTKLCCQFVRHFAEFEALSTGLLFCGDVGGGKSFFAGCIANALIKRNIPVLFTSLRDLVDNRQAAKYCGEELIDLKMYRLFVLDDVGSERLNKADLDTAFCIVDDIYLLQRPLIVTTNLTISQIDNPSSQEIARLYSRIRERAPKAVFISNKKQNRLTEAKAKLAIIDKILGGE